jgi:hypothetical protein
MDHNQNINKTFLVRRHKKIASDCQAVMAELNKVSESNHDFFIQTGGFAQIEMYRAEVERQLELADRQGEL